MGRETKILLGLLGLLAGAFMGVLSMKLLVPRPPAGAGPDVHGDLAATEPHDLVEPPAPAFNTGAFAAAPPLTPPFAVAPASVEAPPADDPPHRDPFVAPVSFDQPVDPAAADPPAAANAGDWQAPPERGPLGPTAPPPATALPFDPAAAPAPIAGGYVVRPGDSWWSVAERSYGDGRLYRAIYAWNRAANPRLSLAPGTPLEIPPLEELAAAWPQLVPRGP